MSVWAVAGAAVGDRRADGDVVCGAVWVWASGAGAVLAAVGGSDGHGMSGPAFEINGEVFFAPHAGKQQEVLRVLTDRVRFGVGPSKWFIRGNRNSGKSVILRKGLLHALAMVIPGLRYGVVRRNMPDLRQNHLIYLGAEMRRLGGDFHETHGIAYYENGSMGFYRQCEDGAEAQRLWDAVEALWG